MIPAPTNRKEKNLAVKRKAKVVKESLSMHGFEMDLIRIYPHGVQEGDFPAMVLRKDLDENVDLIQEKIWKPLIKEFMVKLWFPTLDHVQLAYEHYCQFFGAQPIQLADYFKKGTLSLRNQMVPINQVKALGCTIPIIAGLK